MSCQTMNIILLYVSVVHVDAYALVTQNTCFCVLVFYGWGWDQPNGKNKVCIRGEKNASV